MYIKVIYLAIEWLIVIILTGVIRDIIIHYTLQRDVANNSVIIHTIAGTASRQSTRPYN